MAHLITGKRVVGILLAIFVGCGLAMTFGGYRLLHWQTYTVIRPVKVYQEIIDWPPEHTQEIPALALLPVGTRCKLVREYMKNFYSSRMRCEGRITGWINDQGAFSPTVPVGSLW